MSGSLVMRGTVALDGFLLELDELVIDPGQTVALLGPNGAGKSTVVRAITGLAPLSSGRIELGARVLDAPAEGILVPPHERGIGTAFQDSLLFPHLDVAANVAFRLDDRRQGAAEVGAWLDRIGLGGLARRRVQELSGGQARRVAIARAMIGEPELVVLDEPFAGLDVRAHADVRRLLVEGVDDVRAGRLIVTHDPVDAQILADRMVILEGGRITQAGTPDEIHRRPATRYVAELVGRNLLRGLAVDGVVGVAPELELTIADRSVRGDVRVTVAPQAVSLHAEPPGGSPRNTWRSVIAGLHPVGDVVRVQFEVPVPLVVDVTPGAVRDLDLAVGRSVWLAVKATGLQAEPDTP